MAFTPAQDDTLVELVSKNPPLYDLQVECYKDHVLRDSIWDEISQLLNKSSSDCKKRWKYIRDSFNRLRRKNKTGYRKRTKWALYKKLQFLENVLTKWEEKIESEDYETTQNESNSVVKIEGHGEDDFFEATTSEINGLRMSPEASEESGNEANVADLVEVGTSAAVNTSKKRKHEENIDSYLISYLQEEQNKTVKQPEPEPDADGLDSFCAHMKSILTKLSPTLRVEAKIKLFNVMMEYEMKNLNLKHSN